MMLRIHVDGAPSYEIGDEIWQQSLAAAIREEAEVIADSVGSGLLDGSARQLRNAMQELIVAAMTQALVQVGDTHQAPDGVVYSLLEPSAQDRHREDMVNEVTCSEPVIEDVLRFEDLPVGSSASRRAVVRWSDGTESEGLRWYADEVLICEGDLLGKTREQLRSLHFQRDHDWLQS
jgi:hypothetical protein